MTKKITKTKNALILALIIINVSFLSSCKDNSINSEGNIKVRDIPCILRITSTPILLEGNIIMYSNAVYAYCLDDNERDDTALKTFVEKEYIRCNGEDMYMQSKGIYCWNTVTKGPINSVKIETDYLGEDYTFYAEMFIPIKIIDDSPVAIDFLELDKRIKFHYSGGNNDGKNMLVMLVDGDILNYNEMINYTDKTFKKVFSDNGSGILEFTQYEFFRSIKTYSINEIKSLPIYVNRKKQVKDEMGEGKNIFVADIIQVDYNEISFKVIKQ